MFVRRVTRYGNSLSFPIPKPLLESLELSRGDFVSIHLEHGRIVVNKLNIPSKDIEKAINLEDRRGG